MHLDVKNCAQPRIPLLLCEIPGHHLGTNFSHPQFFSQYQTNGIPVPLHQKSFWLLIFDWMKHILLRVLCCHLSVLLMVISCAAHLQQGFCLQKHVVPDKGLCSWHCIISKGLLKSSMCCGGNVTEFKTKKDGILLRGVRCLHFHDVVHKHVLTCHAPTPHWDTAKSCHCASGDGGRTKVKDYLC